MTERNKWTRQILSVLNRLNTLEGDYPAVRAAKVELITMAMESLEPAQLELYSYINQDDNPVTTNRIVMDFQLQPNHASGLLKSLWSLGLLQRELVVDSTGKRYVYRRVTP